MEYADQLTPRATQIMDLAILGLNSREIAQRLDLSEPYICQIKGAANFQHQLAIRQEKLRERIDDKIVNATVEAGDVLKKSAVAAAKKIVDLVESENDPLALRASESVLDRVGVIKKGDHGPLLQQQIVIIDEKTARAIEETLKMEDGSNAAA